jgi:hypothetical protein
LHSHYLKFLYAASGRSAQVFSLLFFVLYNVCFTTLPGLALGTDEDIDTNRPSFSDSPLVLPQGSGQLENGTLYQHSQHGVNYFDIPETEVRVGVTPRTEFQMFVPNWVLLQTGSSASATVVNSSPTAKTVHSTSSGTINGVTGLAEIGIKRQFHPAFGNLNIAFIGGVNVPTGDRSLSARGVQPVLRCPWTKSITKTVSIGGMQSLLVVNAGHDVEWQNFWLINKAIGTRTSLFTEYAGFYTHQSSPNNIIHFGAVRKLNKNNQIDIHFGFGLNKSAPAAFVGVGYSVRFDRLPVIDQL